MSNKDNLSEGFNLLFKKIVESSARGNVKSLKRQKVIESMLRHEADLQRIYINGNCIVSEEAIRLFLEKKFRECLEKKREFNKAYWINVLGVIVKKYNIMNYNRSAVKRMITQIKKILYTESSDLSYIIGNDNVAFTSELMSLRNEIGKILAKKRNRLIYTRETIHKISLHFSDLLITYIKGEPAKRKYITMERGELALFILFLIVAPKRTIQLLALTIEKTRQLIASQQTEISSKSRTHSETLVIPIKFARLLDMYLQRSGKVEGRLFHTNYNRMFCIYKRELKRLFPEFDGVTKIFHGFRNFYADEHKNDGNNSQYSLGHANTSMTDLYIRNQQRMTCNATLARSINRDFKQKLPMIENFIV